MYVGLLIQQDELERLLFEFVIVIVC